MIGHILRLARHHVYQLKNKSKRSSKWAEVEHTYKANNPTCACCGSVKRLQIHHKKPFHLHPELELDYGNLITLCMDLDCHLIIGHLDNFKNFNPNVAEDAITVSKMPTTDDKKKKMWELVALRKSQKSS